MHVANLRKILLTSAGFETQAIRDTFLGFIGKNPIEIKALFIPTAAVFPAAIDVLPKCMDDLLDIGIPAENIKVFDFTKLYRSVNWFGHTTRRAVLQWISERICKFFVFVTIQ